VKGLSVTPRVIILGIAVVLESLAVLSVAEHLELAPLGTFYPNLISVAVFLLPSLVGLLSQRLTVALLLAALPFWALAVVYLVVARPLWDIDLFSIGALAQRAAGVSVLLLALGLAGWLLRRVIPGLKATV
jgi:hypothetical protein